MGQIRSMAEDATKYRSMAHVAYTRMQVEWSGNMQQGHDAEEKSQKKLHTDWANH